MLSVHYSALMNKNSHLETALCIFWVFILSAIRMLLINRNMQERQTQNTFVREQIPHCFITLLKVIDTNI